MQPDEFRRNVKNRWVFSGAKFTYWIIGGIYHGFVATWVVMLSYKSIQDANREYDVSKEDQASLIYSVILLVVYLKLFIEVGDFQGSGYMLTIVTFIFYFLIQMLLSQSWSIDEYQDIQFRSLTNSRALMIFLPMTVAVVLPDFIISILFKISIQKEDNRTEFEQLMLEKGVSEICKEESVRQRLSFFLKSGSNTNVSKKGPK